jgi:glycerophosphoryl diester phosphodiesterase
MASRRFRDQNQRMTPESPAELSPIIIAHRGASGHRPEHTLESYALAIEMGADYIEPDLVSTKDGVLVARHENEIGSTTNAAERFPGRRTQKVVDGVAVEGWFVEDFTLAELRTLRARERLAFRSHAFDGQFAIPTFDEVLALAHRAGAQRGRVVGVYPELKHPSYFVSIGLDMSPPLLDALRAYGLGTRESPVFVQCFEIATLRALRASTPVRLVLLLSGNDVPYDRAVAGDLRTGTQLVSPESLKDIAHFADAVGVHSRMVVGGEPGDPATLLVADAHAAGLQVHVWTLRPEPEFLAARYAGDALAEVRELTQLGVDGLFGDYPDQLVQVLRR